MVVVIHASFTPSKMAEIRQALGENHQFGAFEGGDYCVPFLDYGDAQLAAVNLNIIQGVHAEVIR